MHREKPVVSPLLQLAERRRAYKRHMTWLDDIAVHRPKVDTSKPPPIQRIVRYEKQQHRNRVMQFLDEQENIRAVKEVHRRQMQTTRAFTAPVNKRSTEHTWTDQLVECEQELLALRQSKSKTTTPERRRPMTSQARPKRVIQDSGMVVVDVDTTPNKKKESPRQSKQKLPDLKETSDDERRESSPRPEIREDKNETRDEMKESSKETKKELESENDKSESVKESRKKESGDNRFDKCMSPQCVYSQDEKSDDEEKVPDILDELITKESEHGSDKANNEEEMKDVGVGETKLDDVVGDLIRENVQDDSNVVDSEHDRNLEQHASEKEPKDESEKEVKDESEKEVKDESEKEVKDESEKEPKDESEKEGKDESEREGKDGNEVGKEEKDESGKDAKNGNESEKEKDGNEKEEGKLTDVIGEALQDQTETTKANEGDDKDGEHKSEQALPEESGEPKLTETIGQTLEQSGGITQANATEEPKLAGDTLPGVLGVIQSVTLDSGEKMAEE